MADIDSARASCGRASIGGLSLDGTGARSKGAGDGPEKTFDYRAKPIDPTSERSCLRRQSRSKRAPPRLKEVRTGSMSEGEERVDAIGLRETGKPGGKVDDAEGSAARGGRALPCEQHGERGR